MSPRYVVDDVRKLFTVEEVQRDRDQTLSLPWGVWDRVERRYLGRYATEREAMGAVPFDPGHPMVRP